MNMDHLDEPFGLDALLNIEALPVLRDARSYMISSYNRNYWNGDDIPVYLRKDEKEGTIADIEGPGCIYRVWLGGGRGARFKFYFDGETEARVILRFSGPHGEPEPQSRGILPLTSGSQTDLDYPPMMLTGTKNGPHLETGICYMPMPFKRSCRIAIEPPIERKYFQINYHLLPEDVPLRTFDPADISQEDLQKIRRIVDMWYHAGEPLRESPCRVEGDISMKDGEEVVLLDLKATAGRINALRIKLPEELRKEPILRSLILKAYWDGEDRASIDTPVGPFFGDAFGTPSQEKPIPLSKDMNANIPDERERERYAFGLPLEYRNFLLGYTRDRGYYTFFPMPFFKGAKIVLINRTGHSLEGMSYEIEYETCEKPEPNVGRFHAMYHRENPTWGIEEPGALKVDFTGRDNYVILKAWGRGHYVGASFFMVQKRRIPQDVESRGVGGICEGNEMIFIDDDPQRTHIGTGTEDYLNQNYWVHDHIYPFDGNREGYRACYRLHISDCIPFSRKIAVTIEHGAGNAHFVDYSSVAYWYQEAKPFVKSGSFGI
jgi:hypothetical protein